MLPLVRPQRAGIALILVGVVFLCNGVVQHARGGSAGFVALGVAFVALGVRRMRRPVPDAAG